MDIDTLFGRVGQGVSAGDVGHIGDEAHLVQRQLLLPRRALHYRREEALRVEEARKPDWGGQDKLISPGLDLKIILVKMLGLRDIYLKLHDP